MSTTKETIAEYKKRYYLSHKKKILSQHKVWKEKNIDKVRAYLKLWARGYRKKRLSSLTQKQLEEWRQKNNIRNKRYRENNLEKLRQYHRNNHLSKSYNITQEVYIGLVKKQKNRCSICKEIQVKNQFHVDHNHKTGKVRGLLCGKCNRGIGMLREDIRILENAIAYLQSY